MVFVSGLAALSWEVLWQIHASLAIGVSAFGTAVTLVATMGGMTVGSLLAGKVLEARPGLPPFRAYALLEATVGLFGILGLGPGFRAALALDVFVYRRAPALSPVAQVAAVCLVLSVPAAAMGATIPVFAVMARYARTGVAALYGWNTAGAAIGVLVVSFALMPALGADVSAALLAAVNVSVAGVAFLVRSREPSSPTELRVDASVASDIAADMVLAFGSGFVALGLEVAWFRSLRAAFWSTTDTFAVLLVSVLVPLAAGAPLSRFFSRRGFRPGTGLAVGGVLTILATPVLSRFDIVFQAQNHAGLGYLLARLGASLLVLGPPMALLGTCLPWVLERHRESARVSRIYAINAAGCVAGSLTVGWLVLRGIGAERAGWVLGLLAVLFSFVSLGPRSRWAAVGLSLGALGVAVGFDSGAGRTRVQGWFAGHLGPPIAIAEGPDSTVAVADNAALKDRELAIDGFSATSESDSTHYMRWMGRLPMILHPSPKRALVICFGTGQTADAVRQEGPERLDIVDVNPDVFKMARYFSSNHDVLDDPRVRAITMDGRAWLRRTEETYDVVTLEPMPPHFAGVNALYSREFYGLVAARLRPGGVAAQWLPFHLVDGDAAAAIVATFSETFGDAILWVDPVDFTGILVGRMGAPSRAFGVSFPGLARAVSRDMTPSAVATAVRLYPEDVRRWAQRGRVITDDNQLLAYDLHPAFKGSSLELMLFHARTLEGLYLEGHPGRPTAQ
jgi:spermidine synthase